MHTKDSATKKILKYVAMGGGIAVLSLAAPLLPLQLAKAYIRGKRFERRAFLRDVKRLQSRKLITFREYADGKAEITLLQDGKQKVLSGNIAQITVKRPKKWDGVWHLVMFDIPKTKNRARDALRHKLRDIGFYQIQKSVFLYPFPCEKEIELLGAYFSVRDNIVMMRVSGFEGEEKLRRHFKL